MEINEPTVRSIRIPEVEIIPPSTTFVNPIIDWNFPVIEMPCAVTRERATSGSGSYDLDPDGNRILCDGAAAIFQAPDLTPGIRAVPPEIKVSDYVKENESNENKVESPKIEIPAIPPRPPCPPVGAIPVGSIGKYGRGRILAYREDLITGKCVAEYEPVKIIETIDHFVPPPALVSGVMVTAAFGASAALLSVPITEVIKKKSKPLQKKIIKFVKKKMGKKEKLLSRSERLREQREKKATDRMWRSLGKK